jgi:SAM-dependent methyltransferase
MRVFETPSLDTLFPRGYVLANADLESAFGFSEVAAREHFEHYGRRERRRQLTEEFVRWRDDPDQKAARFQRFKDCFVALSPDVAHFPVWFGDRFEKVSKYQSESAHGTFPPFAKELADHPEGLYADIGAGLRDVIYANCIYVEVYPSLTADVVIEPSSVLPFKAASLDGIGCFAVLEHVRDPWKMADEFARVVKPGGKIFIDWPFLQPTHGYPSHYYNATREGLRALFERDFSVETLETGSHQGPDYTIQWILSCFVESIKDPEARANFASKTIGEIAAETPQTESWRRILRFLDDTAIERLSCGNHLLGIRRPTPAYARHNELTNGVGRAGQAAKKSRWWRLVFR